MRYCLALFILLFFTLCLQAHNHEHGEEYHFIENKGQWNAAVKFKVEKGNYSIFFENNAFHYQFIQIPDFHMGNQLEDSTFKRHVYKAEFVGSKEEIEIETFTPSPYYHNYFLGSDPSNWKSEVRLYQAIRYKEIYEGIDLEVYESNQHLKYDYYVAPGYSPDAIKIRYQGIKRPKLSAGRLIIKHSLGEVIEEKPYAYQIINGDKIEVACNYTFDSKGNIGFEFPEGYINEYELVIDPVLVFSTYSGSGADNFGQTATYDELGNGYMGGIAFGNGYITTLGAFQASFNATGLAGAIDIAISKFSADGTALSYSTYIGGSGNETVHSLVVDDSLNLYLLGATSSTNYPTSLNAHDRTKESSNTFQTDIGTGFFNGSDIVVTKFNASGTALLGSTFYGGSGIDGINQNPISGNNYDGLNYNYGDSHRGEIVLDSSGFCYIGTTTTSTNLSGAIGNYQGNQDGLIVKFTTNLDSVIWANYIGGGNRDAIYSLKVIDSNKVLVGGGTTSALATNGFPRTDTLSLFPQLNWGGEADGFVSILSADGVTVENSVIVGTTNYDQVYFIEFDRFNNVYAYGQSRGGNFPVLNSPSANMGAGQFFIKMDKNLDSVIFSTTFGNGLGTGTINISPTAFLVDRCQNLYASGWGGSIITNSEGRKVLPSNMPLNNNEPRFGITDGNDFYLYVLNRHADSVLYGSYFGGISSSDHVDGGTSRFDKNGIIYHSVCASCGGPTNDFPTTPNAFGRRDNSSRPNQPALSGCNNALFKFDFQILPEANFTVSRASFCYNDSLPDSLRTIQIVDLSVGANNRLTWDLNGLVIDTVFDTLNYLITQAGTYRFRQIVTDTICAAGDFLELVVEARPDNIDLRAVFDTIVCYEDSATIFAQTNGNVNTFSWSTSKDFSIPLNADPLDSTVRFPLTQGLNKFYVLGENTVTNACEKIDSAFIQYIGTKVTASVLADTVCELSDVQFMASLLNVDTFRWVFGNGIINSVDTNPITSYNSGGPKQIFFEYQNNACLIKDTIPFNLYIQPNDFSFNTPNDTLFCGRGSFDVQIPVTGTISQYQWSSTNEFLDTLNANLQSPSLLLTSNDSSIFYLKVSNQYCESTDSILAQYIEYEVALQNLLDSVCSPYSTELSTVIIGTDSFRIDFGNGMSTTTDSTPIAAYPNEGLYTIELIGSNARCMLADTIRRTLNVIGGVSIIPLADTLICLGDPIQLNGNAQGTGNQFFWDTSPTFTNPLNNPVDSFLLIEPTQTSTYYFRAVKSICNAEDTVIVATEPLDIDVDDFISMCINDTFNIEAFILASGSPLSYNWSPNDSIINGQGTNNISAAPKNDMQFYLQTISATGCVDFDTVEIEVNLPAFTDAIIFGTDSLFKGQTTGLSTNRNGSNLVYSWEPVTGLDNPNSSRPNLTLDESATYRVTITDLNTGCVVVAFRRLTVLEVNCAEPDIFIPTAFTPNQDLNNDILFVRGANLRSIEFQLFNRWGELVFETKDKNVGWDGTYKGREVDPGVFTYQLRAICFDGQNYYTKGNITLIR